MNPPSWTLLLWCGTAATCAAATVGALIGGRHVAKWSLAPVPRSRSHGFVASVLGGMFVLPLIYGFTFELLHNASLATGLLLGLAHAAAAFLAARPRSALRPAFSSAIVALVYGASLGLFYIAS